MKLDSKMISEDELQAIRPNDKLLQEPNWSFLYGDLFLKLELIRTSKFIRVL